jgi:acyl carrier protein
MSGETYTQEQILSGIRILWREMLNCDSPINPDMSLIAQLKDEGIFDDIDFADMLFRLEILFGFKCRMKEWEHFLGFDIRDINEWERTLAPRLTFRALADFVRERLEPIALEPVSLLGKPCLTAGIFRGLQQLAEQIDPKVRQFAPSTPIRSRLRGFRLQLFWSRLRWMIEDQLPPPRQFTFRSRGFFHSLLFKLGAGLLIALWKRDLTGLLEGIGVTFTLFIPLGVIVAFINTHLNPLPKGIETFGDLARVLAAILLDQQTEAASCSTP